MAGSGGSAGAAPPSTYHIGGTITGLTSDGLVLRNNDGDELTVVSGADHFTFATALASQAAYAVTIQTQPSGLTCHVNSATGSVGSADVTSVAIRCSSPKTLVLESSFNSIIATWDDSDRATQPYSIRVTSSPSCTFSNASCPDEQWLQSVASGVAIPSLKPDQAYYATLYSELGDDVRLASNKAAARACAPRFDGEIRALDFGNESILLGGTFQRIRLRTGAATPVHRTTARLAEPLNFPRVDGEVYAVAADGTGGYFIGGAFSTVGDQPRSNLAHVLADGTLDPDWAPSANGSVRRMLVSGSTLYVAGAFSEINGENRHGLASIVSDGSVTTWDPAPDLEVEAMAISNGNLLVGGDFTTIAGVSRSFLARFDSNGALDNWDPAPDHGLFAIVVVDDVIYVGGHFQTIGGQARRHLAALNSAGAVTAWNPDPNSTVRALAVVSGTVYAGGDFTYVGGQSHNSLAAIDANGNATSLAPDPLGDIEAIAVADDASTIYVAGDFGLLIGTAYRAHAAAFSVSDGSLTAWNPEPDGPISSLAVVGDAVILGGQYSGVGGVRRGHLAEFRSTGPITNWNPDANGDVNTLLAISHGIGAYVGGSFTKLGGMTRNRFGFINEDGSIGGLNVDFDGPVRAITAGLLSIYVAGDFTMIGLTARTGLVQLGDGLEPTSWNPNPNGPVQAMVMDNDEGNLYVAGEFTSMGATPRGHIAVFDRINGDMFDWNPDVDGPVYTLAFAGGKAIAGGDFAHVGIYERKNLAAIDAVSGTATAWKPDPDGVVRAVRFGGDQLLVGGEFLNISGQGRSRFAVYDNTYNLSTTYHPMIDDVVWSVGANYDRLYFGGSFESVDGAYTGPFGWLSQ
jgi:hypothetical protein